MGKYLSTMNEKVKITCLLDTLQLRVMVSPLLTVTKVLFKWESLKLVFDEVWHCFDMNIKTTSMVTVVGIVKYLGFIIIFLGFFVYSLFNFYA